MATFEELVAEGSAVPVDGWDFSWFAGRATEERPSWGYARLMGERMATAGRALDLQTGGGEVLATMPRAPEVLVATEGWPANAALARERLAPLGGTVVDLGEDDPLPFPDGYALVPRPDQDGPHPMIRRNGAEVEARLRQCSLYDPDLDLAVRGPARDFAGYALFWPDRRTGVGLVEPMRVEDEHAGRGVAGALLRAGLDLLAGRGCSRLKVSHAVDNPAAGRLYHGAGFRTHQRDRVLVRPPVNLPRSQLFECYEGILEADRWFGPLFINLRLTAIDRPIEINHKKPLMQVQPLMRETYSEQHLRAFDVVDDLGELSERDWNAYRETVVKPNRDHYRPVGAYAAAVRKRGRVPGARGDAGIEGGELDLSKDRTS